MTANTKITVFAILLVLGALAAGVFAGWNRPIAPADVNFIGVHGEKLWAQPSRDARRGGLHPVRE